MGSRGSVQDGGRGGQDGDRGVLRRLGVPGHLPDLGPNAFVACTCAVFRRSGLSGDLLRH